MAKTKAPDFIGELGKENKPNLDNLVNCQACGHLMSGNAFTCPKCAEPVWVKEATSTFWAFVVAHLLIFGICIFVMIVAIIFILIIY